MKVNRDALKRFVTGELPQNLKERENEFFDKIVRENCFRLGLLGLAGAVLQALALFFLIDEAIMRYDLMRWFSLLAVIGLGVFGLFFFRQSKGNLPVSVLWACQAAFAVYYTVFDLGILYISRQMHPGLLQMVPAVLLGGTMAMTGGLSIACFGGYLLGALLMAGEPLLMLYGSAAALAAYMLNRDRAQRMTGNFIDQLLAKQTVLEGKELQKRIAKMTVWDEKLQMNNRRAMSTWLEAVWPLCVRNRIPVEVIVLAPDGMQKVRQEKGTETADARIRQFASALKPFVRRQSDFLGRYDKDKFIILYSGPSETDADMLVKRIQESLLRQYWTDAQEESVSTSMGIVYGVPKDNMVAAQWMTRADDALEKAFMKGPGSVQTEEA